MIVPPKLLKEFIPVDLEIPPAGILRPAQLLPDPGPSLEGTDRLPRFGDEMPPVKLTAAADAVPPAGGGPAAIDPRPPLAGATAGTAGKPPLNGPGNPPVVDPKPPGERRGPPGKNRTPPAP